MPDAPQSGESVTGSLPIGPYPGGDRPAVRQSKRISWHTAVSSTDRQPVPARTLKRADAATQAGHS